MAGILDFFTRDEFLPHAFCLVENPGLIRLHIASDAVTAGAYYSIPVALGYFAYKRREDIPFSGLFVLFAAFILLCGTTHLFGIWTLYVPDYYTQGLLKALTGLASIGTAIVTWRLLPALLLLPGPEKLRKLNSELESIVAMRTGELRAALAEKETLLAKAYHRAAIVGSSDDAIIAIDLKGQITEWNHAAETLSGQPAADVVGKDLAALPGAFALAEDILDLLGAVEAGQPVETREVSCKAGRRLDVSMKASPIRDQSGTIQGVSVIVRDIHERLRDQERMRVATLEVDHRAKNMLAVVLAMIRMTKHDPACRAFVENIQGRIDALSASHSAIVENDWDGALILEIVERTLKPFIASQKIILHGEPIFIKPAAVQALGIVLHELGTNALKHGALSVAGGGARIMWTNLGSEGVRLIWAEHGGPPVAEPERTSFGMRLISRHIPDQLEGGTMLDWCREGLTATLTIPAAYIAETI